MSGQYGAVRDVAARREIQAPLDNRTVALAALNLEPEIAGVNIQRIRLIVCMFSHRSSCTDSTCCACYASHEPLAVICTLLRAMRALVRSAGVPSSAPRE